MHRVFLASALVLSCADLAVAQRIVIGGGYGGGVYGGRYYHSGPTLQIGPGHLHLDSGRYHFGYSDYHRYGPSYGRYLYSPYAYDYYPARPLYVPAAPVAPSTYYEPVPAAPAVAANRGKLRIILPDPEAEVTIDTTKMKTMGRVRIFDTPELEPGFNYWYKVTAIWKEKGETIADVRQVEVPLGTLTVIDFTRPETGDLPAPAKKTK